MRSALKTCAVQVTKPSLAERIIVAHVTILDRTSDSPGRRLLGRRSSVAIGADLYSTIGCNMAEGGDAPLDRHDRHAGVDSSTATEAVYTGFGVEQNDLARIAIVLNAAIKDRNCESTGSGVARRIRRSAGDRCRAHRKRRP